MIKKPECNCCGDEGKQLKVYFCPKCRSKEVGFIFTLGNGFGIFPKMKCRKCRFELFGGFPQIVVSESKLNKNKKRKNKGNKR